jgi:hypothetical protein
VSVNDVSRQIFEAQAEVERTLLHNRDVLLCGGHLYNVLSVIVDSGKAWVYALCRVVGGRRN